MKKASVGIRQLFVVVLVSVILVGAVFFIGHQVINGHFSHSPKSFTADLWAKLQTQSEEKVDPTDANIQFHYDFFTVLEQEAPQRELQAFALEPNPALLARRSGRKAPTEESMQKLSSRFSVQVSSFQNRSDAVALSNELKSKGYGVSILEEEIEGKGKWFRVRIHGGDKRKGAEKLIAKIEQNTGLKGFVVEVM